MENDNLKQLTKLAQIINVDKIISPQEIEEVLQAIIKLLSTFKKDNEALNEETKNSVNPLLEQIKAQQERLEDLAKQAVDSKSQEISEEVSSKVSTALEQVNQLVKEARSIMPKDGNDGKDADEERVINTVLSKIPKAKEVVLDGGEEIVNKINNLEIVPEKQISAKHIKDLPQQIHSYSPVRNITWFDESTLLIDNPTKVKFTGSGVQATVDATGMLVVTITGTASTEIDEIATDSGNHTTFTISNTPNTGTLLVYNGDTGQIFSPSLYTNITTSIIFNSSIAVGSETPVVRAKYGY